MSKSLPVVGSVLGVDVGYSPTRRSSAVCRLDWTATDLTWSIRRFRAIDVERSTAIRDTIGGRPLLAAAFDGPFRRSLDVIGVYRTAEQMLTRRLGKLIGKPGQASAPVGKMLNLHTNHCVRTAIDHGNINRSQHAVAVHELAVVEAFPSSFLGVMLDDPGKLTLRRSDRSDGFFRHLVAVGTLDRLLQDCLPGRRQEKPLSSVVNHDDRAALVCALTALCVASGDYTAVGAEDGWIVLPPITFLGQWAVTPLEVNAQELGMPAFHVSRDRLALGGG